MRKNAKLNIVSCIINEIFNQQFKKTYGGDINSEVST